MRYQRSYSPRIVSGKVMTPADLRRLHKYMLEIEKITVISDEMRAVVESEWPELAHKLPPVCAENLVRLIWWKESRTVGHDGRAALLPFETVGFAVQVDQPA
jgi:hypothetical protein